MQILVPQKTFTDAPAWITALGPAIGGIDPGIQYGPPVVYPTDAEVDAQINAVSGVQYASADLEWMAGDTFNTAEGQAKIIAILARARQLKPQISWSLVGSFPRSVYGYWKDDKTKAAVEAFDQSWVTAGLGSVTDTVQPMMYTAGPTATVSFDQWLADYTAFTAWQIQGAQLLGKPIMPWVSHIAFGAAGDPILPAECLQAMASLYQGWLRQGLVAGFIPFIGWRDVAPPGGNAGYQPYTDADGAAIRTLLSIPMPLPTLPNFSPTPYVRPAQEALSFTSSFVSHFETNPTKTGSATVVPARWTLHQYDPASGALAPDDVATQGHVADISADAATYPAIGGAMYLIGAAIVPYHQVVTTRQQLAVAQAKLTQANVRLANAMRLPTSVANYAQQQAAAQQAVTDAQAIMDAAQAAFSAADAALKAIPLTPPQS